MANPATVAPALFNLTTYLKGSEPTRRVLTTASQAHAASFARTHRVQRHPKRKGKGDPMWNVTVSRSVNRTPEGKVFVLWHVHATYRPNKTHKVMALGQTRD